MIFVSHKMYENHIFYNQYKHSIERIDKNKKIFIIIKNIL